MALRIVHGNGMKKDINSDFNNISAANILLRRAWDSIDEAISMLNDVYGTTDDRNVITDVDWIMDALNIVDNKTNDALSGMNKLMEYTYDIFRREYGL